eukprot:15751236-Heterocapsa_arctica.AAC.1
MSHINATVGVQERVTLGDIDAIAANGKAWARAFRGGSDQVHGEYREAKLVAKVFDLAHAFRQLAIRRSQRSLAVFGVRSAAGVMEWYRQIALPFGAKACVWSFNRVARAISFLLIRILAITSSNYYDDS